MARNDLLRKSRLLTDKHAVKILMATVRSPRSAQQISEQYGIPIAACYRRIRDLEMVGLLHCTERRLSSQGKRVCFYQSRLRTASIQYENGRLRVRFTMQDGETDSEWQDVDLEGGGGEDDRR